MTPPTIEMESVTKRFGDHEAVSGLSLTVARGRAFGLLGPNGSGKSTTIRLLTGLLAPDAGTVGLFGERLGPRNADRLRTRIGVQTDTSLYDTLSARENLRTWGTLYGLRGAALGSRVDEVLELFGLTGRAGSPVGGFSKGMRQKLAIGRAVLHRPELLFLDEPTAGLDPEAAADLIDYLARMVDSSETTLVLSTHQLAGLETLCHDLAIIRDGRLLTAGAVPDLLRRQWPGHRIDLGFRGDPATVGRIVVARGGTVGPEGRTSGSEERTERLAFHIGDEESVSRIVADLVGAGVEVWSVVPRVATIEELYFHTLEEGVRT